MNISESKLSNRAKNALLKAGFNDVLQCRELKKTDLAQIPNIGKKTLAELARFLKNQFKDNHKNELSVPVYDDFYLNAILALPITEIFLSVRTRKVLDELNITHLIDLVLMSYTDIISRRKAGKKTLSEIEYLLSGLGLGFKMPLDKTLIEKIRCRILNAKASSRSLENFILDKYPLRIEFLNSLKYKVFPKEKIAFYLKCFDSYQRGGSLEAAGKEMDLTRERIRQILIKGTKLNLFKYSGREYPYVSKAKILSDYKKYLTLPAVCKENKISLGYLKGLFVAYRIDNVILERLRKERKKEECIEEYNKIVRHLGYHPTTTIIQQNKNWRYLCIKIVKYWGTFDTFREELAIPKPPQGNPSLRENTQEWREQKRKLATILRMQHLDDIRDYLVQVNVASNSDISGECGIRPQRTLFLLNLLIRTGEVVREGAGNGTVYRLLK